ncbi:MAG: DMT family transporter [Actinobacteria bacterium]|nr:DMT family transporter [Actinomycetota bacterium]
MQSIPLRTRGYLLVVTTATLWGFSGTLGKFLMQGAVTPVTLTMSRSLITAIVLFAYLAARHPATLRLTRSTAAWVVGFGVALAITQVFFFSAIERLSVAAAILLEYLAPAIVVVFAWLFQGKSISRVTVASLITVLLGSALVVKAYDLEALSLSAAGILFGLGAAAAFATYILVGEHLQRLHMSVSTSLFYGFSLTTLLLAILQPPWKIAPETFLPGNLALLTIVGLVGTLIPFATFFAALRYIDAGRATIVATLEPMVAGVLAFLWFGETLAWPQLLGGALVVGAIVGLQRERPPEEVVVPPEMIAFTEVAARGEEDPPPDA